MLDGSLWLHKVDKVTHSKNSNSIWLENDEGDRVSIYLHHTDELEYSTVPIIDELIEALEKAKNKAFKNMNEEDQ